MSLENARLAVVRHATSKIETIEDLEQLSSFGFRGEALPSIASVSKFQLVTRTQDQPEALRLSSQGSSEWREQPDSAAVGTTVRAEDLFFNMPARRKFLKSVPTEGTHVADVILHQALAAPEVTFTLTRDGKRVREYLRAASREERALSMFPQETLVRVYAERGPLRIEAFLSSPERARLGATGLHILVNRRAIRDRALARAVSMAYGSVLEGGKCPIGVLYLDLPEHEVDINVHPQKLEVRFRDTRAVTDAIMRSLGPQLAEAFRLPAGGLPSASAPTRMGMGFNHPFSGGAREREFGASSLADSGAPYASQLDSNASVDEPNLFRSVKFYSTLRFRAQVRGMFLLCEGEDALYVVDQHAAHERVTFDRLRRERSGGAGIARQSLLTSCVVELGSTEAELVEQHEEALLSLGVEARRAGPSAIAVSAVPADLHKTSPEALLRALVAELSLERRSFGERVDLMLATLACHGSIRAGDVVHAHVAEALLLALDDVDFAGFCPHGRPVVTRIGFDELERKVGR
jgi:DNA mismatch repair protein MutL